MSRRMLKLMSRFPRRARARARDVAVDVAKAVAPRKGLTKQRERLE